MRQSTFLQRVLLWTTLVIFTSTTSHAADVPLHDAIDQQVEIAFQKWKVSAAVPCSDADFVRRLYLDLTGSIPTANVARTFIANKDADKRSKLIGKLLGSEAFSRHMAVIFDVMWMERRPDKYVTTDEWHTYLKQGFIKNKPLDKLARDILGSDGVKTEDRPAAKFYLDRAVAKDTLVRDIGRLFLGVDLQCAQCHDHPDIDDYLHVHYHGLSVFVAGSKTFKQPDGTMVLQETVMREIEFASVFEPEKTNKTGPRLLASLLEMPNIVDGEEYVEKPSRKVRAVPKFSLRKLLAEKLPSDATPEFARNMANRLWAMMMGRGIVHPLDMHHSANPPSHPELLDLLAKRLSATNFDTRAFLRELALSKTYQRSSIVPETLDPAKIPPESFAVANMKGLTPEQLFQSLIQATESHKLLDLQVEAALKEDEIAYKELLTDKKKLSTARTAKRKERVQEFISLFGSPPGQPEGEFQASLPHALFVANSETVTSWIEPTSDNLTARLNKLNDSTKLIEEAYLSLLSRLPTSEELKVSSMHLANRKENRPAAVLELVWSLVASTEFRLNH